MVNQDLGRVAVVARGIYDPSTAYERLDAVSYNGSSYLVRKYCQGVEPAEGEYYMLMAKAGDSTAANAAAAQALAAAGNANTAAAGASSAKQEAETAASGANAAAASANAAAAAAQDVVDSVQPDIAKVKQTLAAHGEALDNRIKKFYTGNLGAVNIADSDDGAVRDLVIGGRSEQFTTTGANILPYPYYDTTVTVNGVTFTDNGDGSITMNGTATANAEFAFLADDKPGFMDGMVANHPGEKVTFKGLGDGAGRESYFIFAQGFVNNTYVYSSDVTSIVVSEIIHSRQMFVRVVVGATVDNVTIKPMIALGETIATYEPYTGGKPSPSPEYPQEIKGVENCSMIVSNANGSKSQTALIPVTLRGIGDVLDELYVYADGTGKLVQRISKLKLADAEFNEANIKLVGANYRAQLVNTKEAGYEKSHLSDLCSFLPDKSEYTLDIPHFYCSGGNSIYIFTPFGTKTEIIENYGNEYIIYVLANPIETALTAEQVKALFDLRTYYGGTNISYQSENGVEPVVNFDYACALENFVEYIKAAQGDDRKFIYDMDERMTDAEYVAALAYVNSEYAAALTELEV